MQAKKFTIYNIYNNKNLYIYITTIIHYAKAAEFNKPI
jgi:hypothetical protein